MKQDFLLKHVQKMATAGAAFVVLALVVFGCNSTAANARDAIAGFHGYLVSAQSKHTMECVQNHGLLPVCDTLRKADAAQNAAIDALEAYCQFPPHTAVSDPSQKCNAVSSLQGGLTTALANLTAITSDIKAAAQ